MEIITASRAHEIAHSNDNKLFSYWMDRFMHEIHVKSILGETHLDARIPLKGYEEALYATSLELAERIRAAFLDYGYRLSDDGTNGGLYFTISW